MWQKTTTTTTANTDNWYRFQNPVSFLDSIFNFTSLIKLLFQEIDANYSLYSNNENKLVQQKGNLGTYTKTSLLRSRLVPNWYFNSRFCRRDSISWVLFSEDTKWSLPVIIKPEDNCVCRYISLPLHVNVIWIFIWVLYFAMIYFRGSLFSWFFYNRGQREIKEPRN